MTGNDVFLKLENLQRTGSYKERGALNRILTLTEEERRRGLIAASAGNHAQAVSYHATRRGIPAEICMPLATPLNKVMATRRFGAEVLLHGANYDEAYDEALRRSVENNLTLIHPFNDLDVIAGQGTIGLELLEQQPDIEAVVTAIGGGGLISGVACALKNARPEIRVIGVETARLPSMKAAVEKGAPVTLPVATTLADGIAVRRAGDITLPLVKKYVDEIVTVEEEEIASAILLLLEREKILAEGAGAVPLAALLNGKTKLHGKRVVLIVSGGNLDVTILSRIIERGLVQDGRMIRLRIHLPDYPGALHRLTGVLSEHRTNIVATSYDRAYFGVNFGDTAIDLTMETRGAEHVAALLKALTDAGYIFDRIT
jgi:threonine dehydratase